LEDVAYGGEAKEEHDKNVDEIHDKTGAESRYA
jgi:hypothetical protein